MKRMAAAAQMQGSSIDRIGREYHLEDDFQLSTSGPVGFQWKGNKNTQYFSCMSHRWSKFAKWKG